MSNQEPHPGTSQARDAGCKCPMIDNHYGDGYRGDSKKYGWIIVGGCPLHDPEDVKGDRL